MEILLTLAYTAFFVFLIGKLNLFRNAELPLRWFQAVYLLKVLAGIALWWVYTYYYKERSLSDIHKFFDDSEVLYHALLTHPIDFFKMLFGIGDDSGFDHLYYEKMFNWYKPYALQDFNDSRSMIRLNALMRIFSMGYYQVHSVFICFLSFTGLTCIYRFFLPYLMDKKKALFVCVFLVPSVLFWGSGVLKEGLLFFLLGCMLYFVQKILNKKQILLNGILLLFSLYFMKNTKDYILIAVLPGLLSLLSIEFTVFKKSALVSIFFVGALFLTGALIHDVFPGIDPAGTMKKKQEDFIALGRGGMVLKDINTFVYFSYGDTACLIRSGDSLHYRIRKGCAYLGWERASPYDTLKHIQVHDSIVYVVVKNILPSKSYIEIPRLGNLISFAKAVPHALINTMFRPFPNEANSIFMIVSSLENLLIGFLLFLLFFSFKMPDRPASPLLFCLSFVLICFLIIGWTTPILGALTRYKVPAIPFLLIAILFLFDKEKLLFRFPFLKPYFRSHKIHT